jgi:uncharacterized protein (DUF1697 family)
MSKYVALLRGIGPSNPAMHQKKLCGVLENLGFKNVQAVISSGNVLFESDSQDVRSLEDVITEAWPQRLGFTSNTIVRSLDELEEIVAKDAFASYEHGPKTYLLVTFFKEPPKISFSLPYQPPGKGYTLLALHGKTLFSVIDTTRPKAPDLMAWLERQFGKEITSRTWKTVLRILYRMKQPRL